MLTSPIKDIDSIDYESLEVKSLDLVKSIPGWEPVKQIKNEVHTQIFRSVQNSDYWVARFTKLDKQLTTSVEEKFDKYLIGSIPIDLKNNHTVHEQKYINDLYDFKIKELNENSYLIKTFYSLPFPLKKRAFHNLVHIVRNPEYSMVISIPIDPSIMGIDEGFVIGKYSSVELVGKKDDCLEWSMCTCSNPNGLVPYFLTKKSLPGAIAHDVPSFLKYCRNN